jgi:hypothetical protein
MTYTYRTLSMLTFCAAACNPWSTIPAQARQAAISYEEGVNAYFAGYSSKAEEFLSSAIEEDSRDPRAYYFRALSLLRQGRVDLARGDMLTGATLEAQQPHRFAIGSALERVQGPHRLMLEEFRRRARLDASTSAVEEVPSPGSNRTFREGENDVLRKRTFVPLEELLRPEGPRSIVAEPSVEPATPPAAGPPGGAPAARPGIPPAAPPATETQEKDPFADDSGAAAPSAAPPAAPPVPPQEAPIPATPPAEQDENPFGG